MMDDDPASYPSTHSSYPVSYSPSSLTSPSSISTSYQRIIPSDITSLDTYSNYVNGNTAPIVQQAPTKVSEPRYQNASDVDMFSHVSLSESAVSKNSKAYEYSSVPQLTTKGANPYSLTPNTELVSSSLIYGKNRNVYLNKDSELSLLSSRHTPNVEKPLPQTFNSEVACSSSSNYDNKNPIKRSIEDNHDSVHVTKAPPPLNTTSIGSSSPYGWNRKVVPLDNNFCHRRTSSDSLALSGNAPPPPSESLSSSALPVTHPYRSVLMSPTFQTTSPVPLYPPFPPAVPHNSPSSSSVQALRLQDDPCTSKIDPELQTSKCRIKEVNNVPGKRNETYGKRRYKTTLYLVYMLHKSGISKVSS